MNKKYFIFSFFVLSVLLGSLISASPVFADSCPSRTTVNGTSVTFVGELRDAGGDSNTSVWFEYGKSASYGQKTPEKILSQEGIYCITVSGLDPCATYYYRAAARNSAGTSYGERKSFTTTCGSMNVDIKANNSDGPISIGYNSSATLSWTSSNASSCTASGDWSGSKSTSGSESTGNLTSSKTYTITCIGPGGTISDSVRVNVGSIGSLTLEKTVRNLSDGTGFSDRIDANPAEVLSFLIKVKAGNSAAGNVIVRDVLSSRMTYLQGTLKIDGVSSSGSITSGLNIGNLAANEEKTITFSAKLAESNQFTFGNTTLVNLAMASGDNASASDSVTIVVNKTAVAGATTVSTGLTNNIFFDSFVLPLAIALILLWFLKSNFVKIEQWVDARKDEYRRYKSRKTLQAKVKKIRLQEALKRIDS